MIALQSNCYSLLRDKVSIREPEFSKSLSDGNQKRGEIGKHPECPRQCLGHVCSTGTVMRQESSLRQFNRWNLTVDMKPGLVAGAFVKTGLSVFGLSQNNGEIWKCFTLKKNREGAARNAQMNMRDIGRMCSVLSLEQHERIFMLSRTSG